jgi:uncharacterized protein (DUF697 family)
MLWQFFSILILALSYWPDWIIYLNLGLLFVYIAFAESFNGLLACIVSIPFYTTLPDSGFDTLAIWRIVFAWLFAVWMVKENKFRIKDIKFLPWDRYLGLFALVALLLLPFSRFPVQSVKQAAFLINLYLLYLVLVNAVKAKAQVIDAIKYTALSLAAIVLLGFAQLVMTFAGSLDTFWVFWASFVSKIYYGQGLADVLMYSNSWFSYNGSMQLRMFSILPDSHAFALVSAFCLAYLLSLVSTELSPSSLFLDGRAERQHCRGQRRAAIGRTDHQQSDTQAGRESGRKTVSPLRARSRAHRHGTGGDALRGRDLLPGARIHRHSEGQANWPSTPVFRGHRRCPSQDAGL